MYALLRLAGWSALWAGIIHLGQFLVLGIGSVVSGPEVPTPAEAASNYWFGVVGVGTFTLIALGYLVFFSAASTLVWRDAGETGAVWRRAVQTAATVGITCWLLAGSVNLAERGFNARAIGALADSDAIARTVLQSSGVLVSTVATAGAIAFGVWWCAFALRGVRAVVFGWPTASAIVLFGGIVPAAGWLADIGGIPAVVIAFFVLGPVLLRRARRLRDAESAERAGAPATAPGAPATAPVAQ